MKNQPDPMFHVGHISSQQCLERILLDHGRDHRPPDDRALPHLAQCVPAIRVQVAELSIQGAADQVICILGNVKRHVRKAEALAHARRPPEEDGKADVRRVDPGKDALTELAQEEGLVRPFLQCLVEALCEDSAGGVVETPPCFETCHR